MKGKQRLLLLSALISVVATTPTTTDPKLCHFSDEERADISFFDIVLPETNVPTDLTTYTCYTQKIPLTAEREYYAVAFEPLIKNREVMHHMIMFGCKDSPSSESSYNPHYCSAEDNSCHNFVMQWSMGIEGRMCMPPDAGVKFGLSSLQYFALQIHWNNANGINGSTDSSGVRVYYTDKPRRYSIGNVQVGQNDLEIPPNQVHFLQSGGCSSDCTSQWLKHPIYLTRAHIHMHYTGAGGRLELVQGGSNMTSRIVQDTTYDYNSPPAHTFGEPIQVMPGDELRVTCFFNTRDGSKYRNSTLYWGEGSDGEMCYAFITYYPKIEDFDQCIQFDNYDICSGSGAAAFGECIFPSFLRMFETSLGREVLENCVEDSSSSGPNNVNPNANPTNVELRRSKAKNKSNTKKICSDKCDIAIREVTEHPCMQDRLGRHAKRVYLPYTEVWNTVRPILEDWQTECND